MPNNAKKSNSPPRRKSPARNGVGRPSSPNRKSPSPRRSPVRNGVGRPRSPVRNNMVEYKGQIMSLANKHRMQNYNRLVRAGYSNNAAWRAAFR